MFYAIQIRVFGVSVSAVSSATSPAIHVTLVDVERQPFTSDMSAFKLPRVNSKFQPILLQGHERSITNVKYNADGDLLFTCAKDQKPVVWYADSGERLGTYAAHQGAIWDIDADFESKYLVTACADSTSRIFEVVTGVHLATLSHNGPVRAVKWGDGNKRFATITYPRTSRDRGLITVFELSKDFQQAAELGNGAAAVLKVLEIVVDDNEKAICLGWTIGDQYIIAGFDSGNVVKYSAVTGEVVSRKKLHDDCVNRISFNRDKSMFITASRDCTAKLVDPFTLDEIKVFKTDRPVNGAVISPTHPHVLLGGGQDAQNVTTTAGSQGKFETRFFHTVYGEEFARVRGHFGPINALDIHPFGKSYASGAEDGFIRLHHFDANYLNMPDYIPTELK